MMSAEWSQSLGWDKACSQAAPAFNQISLSFPREKENLRFSLRAVA
jgi:hypothetical protein